MPDAGARALRSGATHTIGLIILDLHNPHFWENTAGVEQAARAAGYRLLLSSMDMSAKYGEDAFEDLSGRRIDALILMGSLVDQSTSAQEILARSLKRGLPIVEISDRRQQNHRVDCVRADYRSAAAAAMTHLLALGQSLSRLKRYNVDLFSHVFRFIRRSARLSCSTWVASIS